MTDPLKMHASVPLLEDDPGVTVRDLFLWGRQALGSLGETQAEFEAERFLEHLLGRSRAELYLSFQEPLGMDKRRLFKSWIEKRRTRMPLGYILGRAFFWDLELRVGPGCLVPRPETEILVESVIRLSGLRKDEPLLFWDMGAGSGAIAIALLRYFSASRAVLMDCSSEALSYAQENLKRYALEGRAQVMQTDFRGPLEMLCREMGQKPDLIVSNPPYLSDDDLDCMEPELTYEPHAALWGGADGLDAYRSLIRKAPELLSRGGSLALEVGQGQAACVADMFRQARKFSEPEIILDFLGVERVVMAKRV